MLRILGIAAGAIGILIILIVVFIVWRWTSVGRGMRRRDEKILSRLEHVIRRIESGAAVSPDEIETLAARPENRFMLFAMLRGSQSPQTLPAKYSSSIAQGASALVYWMMHPNELQDAPERIEFLETIQRSINGEDADFHVYRYKMPEGHWAAKDGWILGLAGPMRRDVEPYSERPSAFSRVGDLEGKVKPTELVDWYVSMLQQKNMIK
jgi:hypothetical protein